MSNSKNIADIYAQVPHMECKGLCRQSCGPIGCSAAEVEDLQNNGINLPTIGEHALAGPITCSHLDDLGRCSIYENRPMICRLWGSVRAMPCPHGCMPAGGYLPESKSRALLKELEAMTDGEFYFSQPTDIKTKQAGDAQ